MLNKKIMILALILLSLLTISSVSASEINDSSDLLGVDNNDSMLDVDDDGLMEKNSEGTFTDLVNEIAKANGQLNLDRNYTYNEETDSGYWSGIEIAKSIVINGNGFTINGNNQVRMFRISASNVVLNNINFANSYMRDSGAAIYWYGSDGILFNCSFLNSTTNYATSSGGAIYWQGSHGTLYDCNFVNMCSDFYGGSIYWTGNDGTLYDCSFNCTKSDEGGAVCWTGSNGILHDCSFVDCSAEDGAAIYWKSSDGALFNCSFVRSISRWGAAVVWYGYYNVMSGCNFVNCSEYMGFAIDWKGYKGVITNCSFMNSYVEWEGNYGTLYDCSFMNSYVEWEGNYGTLYDCSFVSSSPSHNGGAVCWEGNYGTLYDCSFVNCFNNYNGGAVYWLGSNGGITNCNFRNCYSDDIAGAIYWNEYASKGSVKNCSFVNCSSDDGAGVISWSGVDGVIGNCSFVDSSSEHEGGSVVFKGLNGVIANCSFVNSFARGNGGAIYWSGVDGTLEGCSFVNSSTYDNGGAIYLSGSNGTIYYCSFVNSSAEYNRGGGIYFKGANCSLIASSFKGNIARVGPDWYSEQPIIVINRTSTVLLASNLNIDYGTSKDLIVTLKDVNNNRLAGEQIFILLDDVKYRLETDSKGQVSLAIPNDLSPKKYIATIFYTGNILYDSSDISVNIVVSKSHTNVSIIYNNDVRELVATLTNNATGQPIGGATIGFKVNNKTYNVKTDVDGQSKLSTIRLPLGDNTATVTFKGNVNYKPSNATMDFTNKVNTALLAVYDDGANEIVVTLIDADTDKTLPRGNIIVKLAGSTYTGKTDSKGQFKVSTADLALGTYTATVTYKGTAKYNPSKTTLKVPIQVVTSLSLVYNVNTNQIIATLADNATGQVIGGGNIAFEINGVNYTAKTNSLGQAKVSTKDLAPGTYTANAEYKGNSKYTSSSVSATFTVKIAITISAVYNSDSKELIATLINDVTLQPILGATVSFKINNGVYKVATDNSGQAKLSVADFPLGTYDALISFGGNLKYNPASASLSVPIKANTSLDVVYDSDSKQFIATLTNGIGGEPVSGVDVNVELNGVSYTIKTNSKGQVKVSAADFTPNVYPANASFSGNSMYDPSATSMDILIDVDTKVSAVYKDGVLTATLVNEATGKGINGADLFVSFGDVNYTVKTNSDGQATVSTRDLAPGSYTAVVSFDGNGGSPSATRIDIDVKIDAFFLVDDISVEYGDDVDLVATLINYATGKGIVGATVGFKFNGKSYTAKTDSNGQVKVTVSGFNPGSYDATVTYNGNTKYNPAKATFNVLVNKITTSFEVYYDSETNEIVATLINGATGKGVFRGTVGIFLNNVKNIIVTDENGQVRLSLGDVDSTSFTAYVTYAGNAKYLASSRTLTPSENKTESYISTVYKKETGEIVATLINKATNKGVVGGTVSIVINNVRNDIKTDANGQAKVSIANLAPNVYKVVSSYAGNTKYTATTETIYITKT